MTNPKGRMFFSYKRQAIVDAEPLLASLREHGVPTWLDTSNLEHEAANPELHQVLDSPDTAGVIMFLTPEVAHSATIREIEAPRILARLERAKATNDPFFVVPIAAGGLTRSNAANVLGSQIDFGEFQTHNAEEYPRPPQKEIADQVARRILGARLTRIDRTELPHLPMRISLSSRESPGFDAAECLSVDFSQWFEDRHASPHAWATQIRPNLDAIQMMFRRNARRRHIELTGRCSLPLAFAAGVAFRLPRGTSASWVQQTNGHDHQWSNGQAGQPHGFEVTEKPVIPGAADMLVTIGITTDVRPDVANSDCFPSQYRRVIHFQRPAAPFNLSPQQGAQLAEDVANAIRRAMVEAPNIARIHLVVAGPVAFAFLLGQRLNTFPPIQTYEHGLVGAVGRYRIAGLIDPSNAALN